MNTSASSKLILCLAQFTTEMLELLVRFYNSSEKYSGGWFYGGWESSRWITEYIWISPVTMLGILSLWRSCERILQWFFCGYLWCKVCCTNLITTYEAYLGVYSSLIRWSLQCRFVFGVTALLPLLTSTVAVLVNEEPLPLGERSVSLSVSGSELIESSKQRFMQIWNSVKQPSICLPTLFIFLWQATPQSDSAMFFFMYVPHTHLSA